MKRAAGTVAERLSKLCAQGMRIAVVEAGPWYANAIAYCNTLSLSGTGWRLPTIRELLTIVDPTKDSPSIDPTAFPSTPTDYFWSSSPDVDSSDHAWTVSFSSGESGIYSAIDASHRVRCVR